MPRLPSPPASVSPKPLIIIAAVVGLSAIAFAYTAGWLSPHRLTPRKMVAALAPPGGPALGHRRNLDASVLAVKLVKGAQLKIIPGAPHGLCTTDAALINDELLAFLQKG